MVMSSLFGVEPQEIGAATSMETLEAWDSVQHVSLIMALEQEFGVQLPVTDAFKMTDFAAVCRTVKERTSA